MMPDDICTLFVKFLNKFEPISGQSTESHLTELREVMPQILLVVLYDGKNGVQNLVGIIQDPTTYTSDYTAAFPQPHKPVI